jgi:hypothetical protein
MQLCQRHLAAKEVPACAITWRVEVQNEVRCDAVEELAVTVCVCVCVCVCRAPRACLPNNRIQLIGTEQRDPRLPCPTMVKEWRCARAFGGGQRWVGEMCAWWSK